MRVASPKTLGLYKPDPKVYMHAKNEPDQLLY